MRSPKTTLAILVLAALLLPVDADAYPSLCGTVPAVCDYAGPTAPRLLSDVCLSSTGVVTLKTGSCASGSTAYFVERGEVNPSSGHVDAYIALADACDTAGTCIEYAPHSGAWASVICCITADECYPGSNCGGVLKWCEDGVSNLDGTVTCFLEEDLEF